VNRTSSMTRVLAICVVLAPALYTACSDELGNQSLSAPGYQHDTPDATTGVIADDDDDNSNVYEAGPEPEFDSSVPLMEASVMDSGVMDSGVKDSGVMDSGVKDSGVADSGADSGIADAAAGQ